MSLRDLGLYLQLVAPDSFPVISLGHHKVYAVRSLNNNSNIKGNDKIAQQPSSKNLLNQQQMVFIDAFNLCLEDSRS